MNTHFSKRTLFIVLAVFLTLFLLSACGGSSGPEISIEDIWARQSPMSTGNGAVFMTIENHGKAPDALIGASTDICRIVEIHETKMENDVMRMSPIPGQRLEIPAKGKVELKPGGYHVMLIDLKQQLNPGDTFDLTLSFEKSGEKVMHVEVKAMEGMGG